MPVIGAPLWLQTAPKHKCTLLDVAERGDCVSDLNTDTSQVATKTASLKLNSSSSSKANRDRIKALRDQTMAPKALYSLYSIRVRALGARSRRTARPGIKSRRTIRREGGRE